MDPLRPDLRYDADLSALSPALAERWVSLQADRVTHAWLDQALAGRHGRFATWVHDVAVRFSSDFDVNGLLGMHDMFLLGTEQWRLLLGDAGASGEGRGRLLDVGAGDGAVTAHLAPLFEELVTIETSSWLARRLRRRGFRCHVGELSELPSTERFDVVALLNVLDRVHEPLRLLDESRAHLKSGGRLLLATPLPFNPFVFDGPATIDPRRRIELQSDSWEAALDDLVRVALTPRELAVDAVTRVPYLSRGDARHEIYARDDAVIVARAA